MGLETTIRNYGDSGQQNSPILQKVVALSNGEVELIAGVANQQIQVIGLIITSDTAGLYTIKSDQSDEDDDILAITLTAEQLFFKAYVPPVNDGALFVVGDGKALDITVGPSPTAATALIVYRTRGQGS